MTFKLIHLAAPLSLIASRAACSSSSADARVLGPSNGGATAPIDDAPGVCCPASTGGCAEMGGYHADGRCDLNRICDNMWEQRIVPDEHGCQKLSWKKPPVNTTYAGTGSCSDPVFNGVPWGGAKDAGADAGLNSDFTDASSDAH